MEDLARLRELFRQAADAIDVIISADPGSKELNEAQVKFMTTMIQIQAFSER